MSRAPRPRLLLVGFEPWDERTYPHTRCVLEQLAAHFSLDYVHLEERGFFAEKMLSPRPLRARLRATLPPILHSVATSLDLLSKRKPHDIVVAIDMFAYGLLDVMLRPRRLILWSHDVVGPDLRAFQTVPQRIINAAARRALTKRRLVLIQDPDRLAMLRTTLSLTVELDAHMLPVVLPASGLRKAHPASPDKPRVIQIGGIHAARFSGELLDHYQSHAHEYALHLHGYVSSELRARCAASVMKPEVSEGFVSERGLSELLLSQDVGFVGYRATDVNHRLIGNASGQTVELLRLGLPIVVAGTTNLNDVVTQSGAGVALRSMEDLVPALYRIMADYAGFSARSLALFESRFRAETFLPALVAWLQHF
jgi:hypothetical protein